MILGSIYMASPGIPHRLFSVSQPTPVCYCRRYGTPPCQFRPANSLLKSNNRPATRVGSPRNRPTSVVFAAQSGLFEALQTVWKVGKDGVEAGTNLVPDSIPRPIARISVILVGGYVALKLLESCLAATLFVAANMGLIYLASVALLNKDEDPKRVGDGSGGTTSTEDSLEEARRIMEKYK